MVFGNISLVGMLKQRMSWHHDRQAVLAENVANADTPNYRARDVVQPDFGPAARGVAGVQLAATDPRHFGLGGGAFPPEPDRVKTYEITPEGNGAVLEEEMLRVSQNAIDYQMVSQLYSRGLGVLKTAIGRRA